MCPVKILKVKKHIRKCYGALSSSLSRHRPSVCVAYTSVTNHRTPTRYVDSVRNSFKWELMEAVLPTGYTPPFNSYIIQSVARPGPSGVDSRTGYGRSGRARHVLLTDDSVPFVQLMVYSWAYREQLRAARNRDEYI